MRENTVRRTETATSTDGVVRANGPTSTDTVTLVVIDDDPGDVELLRRHLEQVPEWQVELHAFTDPRRGMAELDHYPDAVVCLDYLLGAGGATGLELLRLIRAAGYDAPVVMLTGRGDEEIAVECMQAGAADYLPKSLLSSKTLQRAIGNALQKHRLQRELKAYRRYLEESNRELSRRTTEIQTFYHTLSHELKTPLTAAREFLSIVTDGLAGPLNEMQTEYLTIAMGCCDQIAFHLNDLLDMTRLETGKLVVEPAPASVADIVQRVVTSLGPVATDKGLRLSQDIPANLPAVFVDQARIVQVLTNLLTNAMKFTPAGGAVGVSASRSRERPEFVTVAVYDTGRGIDEKELEHIFDRLYQVHRDDAESGGGLGIGLSICREIVRQHGGRITVDSKPGEGSTFSVELPLTAAAGVADGPESEGQEATL